MIQSQPYITLPYLSKKSGTSVDVKVDVKNVTEKGREGKDQARYFMWIIFTLYLLDKTNAQLPIILLAPKILFVYCLYSSDVLIGLGLGLYFLSWLVLINN